MILDRFFEMNRSLCRRIGRFLPQSKPIQQFEGHPLFRLYEKVVVRYMNSRPNQVVLDIGGGEACTFAKYRDPAVNATIVAVDVSEKAMMNNVDVNEKKVADVTEDLSFGDQEVDLVVSRTLLEHLHNIEIFIADSNRVLKKNGYFISLFPSKFAPFALINRMLPVSLSSKLLYYLIPRGRGFTGYPAYYDRCYYSAVKSLLEKHGFEIVDVHLNYSQSHYFSFFVPLYLLSALYEIILQAVGARNLCAYVLVVARKK